MVRTIQWLALLFFTVGAVEGQEAPDLELAWPEGWTVSETPFDQVGLKGKKIRATAVKTDGPPSVIELMYLFRNDSGEADLATEFEIAVGSVERNLKGGGFTVTRGSFEDSSMGEVPSLEVSVRAQSEGKDVVVSMMMAMTEKFVYSLTFTATRARYIEHGLEYQRFLRGLRIE